MSKVKVKKQSTFIDMTAMSDVTVLLLTFFMLTSNFIKKEPVQLQTPSSVSEVKVPEYDILTILIDPQGRVFLNLNFAKIEDKDKVLKTVGDQYHVTFSDKEVKAFRDLTSIGVPVGGMSHFLSEPIESQDQYLKKCPGLPTDTIVSSKNEFAMWVSAADRVFEERDKLQIAIKSDSKTPYPMVKNVLSTLQDLHLNKYSLVTSLKPMPANF